MVMTSVFLGASTEANANSRRRFRGRKSLSCGGREAVNALGPGRQREDKEWMRRTWYLHAMEFILP